MRNLFRAASAAAVVAPLLFGVSPAFAGSPERYAELIASHASRNGVPVQLAEAVIRYESNFNPGVTGRAGEIGLMQIKLQTARGMGYSGSRRGLYDPATNIAWGMKYLGTAVRMSGGSQCGTLSRYNAGLFTRRLVPSYCRQVIAKSNLGHHLRGQEIRLASAHHHAQGQEMRVARAERVYHGHHRREVVAMNTPARHVKAREQRVAYLARAGHGHPGHRHAGDGDVLAYAGGSRVEATRSIFDDLFASN